MCVLVAPVVLKLTPELAGIRSSPEEFDTIEDCDELYNYELVHGYWLAPPPTSENANQRALGYLLRFYKDHIPREPPSISRCPSTPSVRPIAAAAPTASYGQD
jgi:hypothetical protein